MPNLFHCSQKQRKAALRKERRQRKRQALAQARDTGLRQSLVVVKCYYWVVRLTRLSKLFCRF